MAFFTALAGKLEIIVFEAEHVAIVADRGAAGLVERNLVLVRHLIETTRDLRCAGEVVIKVVWELFEDVGGPDREEGTEIEFDIESAPKGPRATNVVRN